MKLLPSALLAFMFLVCHPALLLANPSDYSVHQTAESVQAARGSIVAAARNLSDMRGSLAGNEAQAVGQVITEAWLLVAAAAGVVDTGDIYVRVETPGDKSTVLEFLGHSAGRYAKQVEVSLPFLNDCLTRIATPAALAEATRVRDKMLEARAASRPFEEFGT